MSEEYLVYTLKPKKIKWWNVKRGRYDENTRILEHTDLFEIIMSDVGVKVNEEQSKKVEGFHMDAMEIIIKIYMRAKTMQPPTGGMNHD